VVPSLEPLISNSKILHAYIARFVIVVFGEKFFFDLNKASSRLKQEQFSSKFSFYIAGAFMFMFTPVHSPR
jgi:hypothetical protein